MTFDKTYIDIIEAIIKAGYEKVNPRTGVKTRSLFNMQISAEDDSKGYHSIPLTNIRKIGWKSALIETLWLLGLHKNDERYKDLPVTNTKYLVDNGCKYWKPWEDINGNLGPVYGAQLTEWHTSDGEVINQVENLITKLRETPNDRRLVLTMWNPGELDKMVLPPCHHTMEFYSQPLKNGKKYLHTRWIQRSADMPIGVPFDMLIYSFINKIIAMCTDHIPGSVYGLLGDCHIYADQEEAALELIRRSYQGELSKCTKPQLKCSERLMDIIKDKGFIELSDIAIDGSDFTVTNYNPLPKINIPVTV